jgi:hypothetical protein
MLLLLVGVIVLIFVIDSHAQTGSEPTRTKDKLLDKVDPDLVVLIEEYRQQGRSDPFTPGNPLLRLVDGRVLIDAVAIDDATVLLADLEGIGLQKGAAFGRIVSGQLPINAIDNLANLESLHSIQPVYAATHNATVAATKERSRQPEEGTTPKQHSCSGRSSD